MTAASSHAWLAAAFDKFLADYADVLPKPITDMDKTRLRIAFNTGVVVGVDRFEHDYTTTRSLMGTRQ